MEHISNLRTNDTRLRTKQAGQIYWTRWFRFDQLNNHNEANVFKIG